MPGMLTLPHLIEQEIDQRIHEGCPLDREAYLERLRAIDGANRRALEALYDELMALEPTPDFPFTEPSDLEGIRAARPRSHTFRAEVPAQEVFERIHGGWLGRCCGCSLGKPLEKNPYFNDPEHQQRKRIQQWLEGAAAWPLSFYVPEHSLAERIGLSVWALGCTDDAIECMQIDDDINYMILAMKMLEDVAASGKTPADFDTCDVAQTWLKLLTYDQATSGQTYVNLINDERFVRWGGSRESMESMDWRDISCRQNPFREDIAAQIRADVYGYIAPGDPERAAEYAWRDARMSHVKNGIYGEMFVAAMIAAAFIEKDPYRIVEIGHAQIPAHSRLATAIRTVVKLARKHDEWTGCWDAMMEQFGGYEAVHVIPNALICVMGLLYGQGNFEKSICTAVSCGLDTDCNGATVGSILGVMHGARKVPRKWASPLNNTIKSGVLHFSQTTISDCARRTAKIVETINGRKPKPRRTPEPA